MRKKPGPKPRGLVKIEWSADFAYAIGLIVSDGSLSKDARHVVFVSKDLDQITNFCKALQISYIPKSYRNGTGGYAYRIQIGDVAFHAFLMGIGLTPNKSLTIGSVSVPDEYFAHYLRGYFDGDGYSNSYFDPRWKSSFMFYIGFVCASRAHIDWLQEKIGGHTGCLGHVSMTTRSNGCYQLRYSKGEALSLALFMYEHRQNMYLDRKYLKIKRVFGIVGHHI